MESWREQPVVFWTFLLPGGLWLLGFFLAPLTLVWLSRSASARVRWTS